MRRQSRSNFVSLHGGLVPGGETVVSVLDATSLFVRRSSENLSKLELVRVKLNPDRLTTGCARSVVASHWGKGCDKGRLQWAIFFGL
jgi:hypothetical protein